MGQRARPELAALFIAGAVALPGEAPGNVEFRPRCLSSPARTPDGHCCPRDNAWSPSCSCCRPLRALAHECESRRALDKCIEAGDLYAHGASQDPARAADMFEQACARGMAIGCVKLARYYEGGIGRRKDPARADGLYAKACAGGIGCACLVVGVDLSQPGRSERDARRGTTLLARACDAGDVQACLWLARRYREGHGVARSSETAEALRARACAARSRDACDGVDPVYLRAVLRERCQGR
jgi:TPR repeat protein